MIERYWEGKYDKSVPQLPVPNGDGTEVLTVDDVFRYRGIEASTMPIFALPDFGTPSMNVVPENDGQVYGEFIHEQTSMSTVWTISHGLERLPFVQVVDVTSRALDDNEYELVHISTNQLTLTFSSPMVGVARLI